jgi:hypothetical protein
MGEDRFVSQGQLDTLARLKEIEGCNAFYLVGGTAIAFHLGHRVSRDLDLFSRGRNVDLDSMRGSLVERMPGVEVIAMSEVTLQIRLEATPVDFVVYPYAPIDEPANGPSGFPVASLRDLATMKLAAIAKRGIKRDFWDLYEILNRSGLTLREVLEAYSSKFGRSASESYYVVRSLTYFEDAEKSVTDPRGMTKALWERVKEFFIENVPHSLL